jgi:type I restriction enzyme R subunit
VSNEAETCRKYVVPKLIAGGWDDEPHSIAEQRTITYGRIVLTGNRAYRRKQKRADYLLRYTRDFPIAVVEAKPEYKLPADGLQQAKDYAEVLDLRFAYSTNGHGIVEFDYLRGQERELSDFPSPQELWSRLRGTELQTLDDQAAERLLTPSPVMADKPPRYYQTVAINRALEAILSGKQRVLLTMATGTGKTVVAFHICWKLWSSLWNRTGEYRRPKILYLADRNILVDDPKDKTFVLFGDARHKIEREAVKGREMYFATYQAIARDERRPGLYRDYPPDFFDLVVVDECHRGSAADESNWREILEYFSPAYQLGMTATPLREDNRDTYLYFGNPVYTYSLRQGIEDGFLAPYRVHRVITTVDAAGWRPTAGELDRYAREIPDEEYHTPDFERKVALRARTQIIAKHITDFLKENGRFSKTIVFCVDQEHALEMRQALVNLNSDLVRQYPDYVCRVTSYEAEIGRGHLGRFQDPESETPAILTTSQMLTTGVDVPTCKVVAIARVVNSIVEFKQIIGRGTRVRDDYNKLFFSILDYTGSATRHFADPEFDGEPARVTEEELNEAGERVTISAVEREEPDEQEIVEGEVLVDGPWVHEGGEERPVAPRKYYVDGGHFEIAAHLVHELDPDGHQLRVIKYTDYAAEMVRTLYPTGAHLRRRWVSAEQRAEIIQALDDRGIDFAHLATVTKQPDADPFDLLCHLAYNAPLRTRRERADRLRREEREFFDRYGPEARQVLDRLLEKYTDHGVAQFVLPDVLKLLPISEYGNPTEIAALFGGAQKLREAVAELQTRIYAA